MEERHRPIKRYVKFHFALFHEGLSRRPTKRIPRWFNARQYQSGALCPSPLLTAHARTVPPSPINYARAANSPCKTYEFERKKARKRRVFKAWSDRGLYSYAEARNNAGKTARALVQLVNSRLAPTSHGSSWIPPFMAWRTIASRYPPIPIPVRPPIPPYVRIHTRFIRDRGRLAADVGREREGSRIRRESVIYRRIGRPFPIRATHRDRVVLYCAIYLECERGGRIF